MGAHHEVIIEEFSRFSTVGAYATHMGGKMDHNVGWRTAAGKRSSGIKHAAHLVEIAEIRPFLARDKYQSVVLT